MALQHLPALPHNQRIECMDALQNTLNSVRLAVLDRVGNPLVGSFFLAWAVWNFRLLMVILGEGPWKEKIAYIDQSLMKTWCDWLLHGYLAPLVFALIWVFFLPWVFRKVQVYHHGQLAKTAQAVMLAQDKQPIDEEIVTQLRRDLRETEGTWKKEQARYEEMIAEYMERLKQSETQSQHAQAATQHAEHFFPSYGMDAQFSIIPENMSAVGGGLGADNSDDQSQAQAKGESQAELDPILSVIDTKKIDENGNPIWPRALDKVDLTQLPLATAKKVSGYQFSLNDVKALLAMRNSDEVDADFLVKALGVERLDAKLVLDNLLRLQLLTGTGIVDGKFFRSFRLNADGRILTAFFKKALGESPVA